MGSLQGLQGWVAGLAFLVATVIALWGGIKYGPKGEWGSFFKVVGIAVALMVLTGGQFLGTLGTAGGNIGGQITDTISSE